ncbi:hypothetical protein [Ekhidna sp.]|uniref:toxin-antitoxin system YwqK family antitoxin n=1 Tax=Ekhidna sp. TaxID=2608089 RepID=UPI003297C93A
MKKYIWVLAFIIGACGDSNSTSSSSANVSQIPGGAILQDYEAIPGLQKAIIKAEDITIGEGDFLNGMYHGTWTSYGVDGRLQSLTTYFEGKKQGVQLLFDNTGYVQTKASYHNDQLSGEYLVYNRRKIVERRNYASGALHGLQERFYVDGTKMEEKNFVSGKIDGVARWYDEEGNLTIEYEYDMGELVDK